MENVYITKVILEEVRNLTYAEIPLSTKEKKNLIITGKNGSGKTTVLNALASYLNAVFESNGVEQTEKYIKQEEKELEYEKTKGGTESDIRGYEECIHGLKNELFRVKQGIEFELNWPREHAHQLFQDGRVILAYYKADRVFRTDIPRHVEKVQLQDQYSIDENPRDNLVKYLLDLKMTQALSATNGKQEKAADIQRWFDNFEKLLQKIFENKQLKLEFDEETFKFSIKEPEKEAYDFNSLSSGYAAILDIVVDLMIRMEKQTNRTFQYDIPGIVLIDEIETHLHLELQKKIMELLTTMFPNIQFIVSTHSPFILNSLENVVIYDLEQKTLVNSNTGLSNIPYDGIVEGYFGASRLSDELADKFQRYKELAVKNNLTDDDIEEITQLEMYLDEIPDYLNLNITTEYQKIKLELSQRTDI